MTTEVSLRIDLMSKEATIGSELEFLTALKIGLVLSGLTMIWVMERKNTLLSGPRSQAITWRFTSSPPKIPPPAAVLE